MDSVRSKNSDEYSDQSHLSARFPNYKRWGMRGSEAPPGPVRSSSRRYRWRMLGRVLLHFVRWENAKNAGKDRGFVMRRIVAGRVQERVFDAAKFSKNIEQYQILNIHAKLLLYKEPHQRCQQDLVVILGYMNRMTCFNKFSVFVKRELAGKIMYNCWEKGSVIFTEGAQPHFFYFLLSGSVQLYKSCSSFTDDDASQEEAEENEGSKFRPYGKPIEEGGVFGESALADESPRMSTAIASESMECFTLKREDFLSLLGAYHDEEKCLKSDVIRSIPETKGVSEADMRRAIDSSYLRQYAKGAMMINGEEHFNPTGDRDPNSIHEPWAHVVVSGSVSLQKRLYLHQDPLPCGTTIVRIPEGAEREPAAPLPLISMKNPALDDVRKGVSEATLRRITDRVRESVCLEEPFQCKVPVPIPPPRAPALKYLSVQTYLPGQVFLPFSKECDYVIGAKEPTMILFLPKSPFLLHKSGVRMVRMFDELANSLIPVRPSIQQYNSGRIWSDYRKQLVRQVLVDKMLRKSLS